MAAPAAFSLHLRWSEGCLSLVRRFINGHMTDGDGSAAFSSRGIKSIEVGYRVLLAVQRGPGSVQLAEIARRAGLSGGAAHNYLASLVRTGLVEIEGRGRYRLGPSAFALSLNSFSQLNGLEIMKAEAEGLHRHTGQSTAVVVWSQAGPISVFTLPAENLRGMDFRPGRVPMMGTGAGLVYAAYLDENEVIEPVEYEMSLAGDSPEAPHAWIARAKKEVTPRGYGLLSHEEQEYYALAAPVWARDGRIPFVLALLSRDRRTDPEVDRLHLDQLLAACGRASAILSHTETSGPLARGRR